MVSIARHPPRVNGGAAETPQFLPRLSAAELDAATFETEYLIDRTLVAGQPMIIAGSKKTLKTSILIDMGISLSVGGFFLGKLRVSRACRVGILSGESGMSTIQETARRIAHTAGYSLGDLDNLVFSDSLPRFDNAAHVEALKRFILDDALEVVFLDPAYFCMRGTDAGNLFVQGEQLRNANQVCTDTGCTMILAHHTAKRRGAHLDVFDPPELEDVAWSGFQEWARQWALFGRREKYEPGTGEHKLWMNVGGSAGHSALWALDIAEGLPPDRFWDVTVKHADEAREDALERREAAKEERAQKRAEAKMEGNKRRIVEAMVAFPEGESKSGIRAAAGLHSTQFAPAFADLIRAKNVVTCEVHKSNWRAPITGYKLANG
jgi:hypothetical protein